MAGSGGRLILVGLPLVVIGVVLALVLSGTASGIGAAIAVLGALPVIAGIVLLLSAGTEQHSRKGRPYA
jgi:multidrug efflux pump subunit AcrB